MTRSISRLILILTPFVFSFALGLDIYIPIIPQMTAIFDTTPATIHLTLSLFLGITGIGQLFIGPISDRYGRKAVFYFGSLSYMLGSLLCAVSPHISYLIAGRMIAALGACAMIVTSFALVRDLFCSKESGKLYSFLNGAIGISPTFAPILGGYLSFYFGWQSIFLFLALIGLFTTYLTWHSIQETHPVENRVSLDGAIIHRYQRIFKDRQFLTYTALASLAEGIFFCFFSISPFIIIDVLGVEMQRFGYYFAVFGLVIASGGFIAGKLIELTSCKTTILAGTWLMLFGGISMILWNYLAGLTLSGFLIPMAIACMGAMFLVGACAAGALEHFAEIAGTAAAAFGASQFTVASMIGGLLMQFPVSSTIPYSIVIVATALLCFLIFSRRPSSES